MKCILLPVFLLLMLSSTGCSLFGWYDQVNPDSRPLPSEMETWTKPNIDEVQRKEDWIACVGNSAGYAAFSKPKPGESRSDEYIQANKETDAAQACMKKKGYRYTGSCKGPFGVRFACKGKSIFNL